MSYQYLFCSSCGQRRTGHSFRCSVCGNLLRRAETAKSVTIVQFKPVVQAKPEVRKPVAA
jgi:hypothetical protein